MHGSQKKIINFKLYTARIELVESSQYILVKLDVKSEGIRMGMP